MVPQFSKLLSSYFYQKTVFWTSTMQLVWLKACQRKTHSHLWLSQIRSNLSALEQESHSAKIRWKILTDEPVRLSPAKEKHIPHRIHAASNWFLSGLTGSKLFFFLGSKEKQNICTLVWNDWENSIHRNIAIFYVAISYSFKDTKCPNFIH